MSTSKATPYLELGAVALCALVFVGLPKPPDQVVPLVAFMLASVVGWGLYLGVRLSSQPTLADRWGLRARVHLDAMARALAPPLIAIVAIGAIVAWLRGRPLLAPYLWLSLLLYPIWGVVQQWLVQAIFIDNVRILTGAKLPVLMLLGGVGFGAIHIEHPLLVVATGLMGALYVAAFQKWRNIWPLGVVHGWLGSLFYPWILDRNPIEEIIGLLPLS